MNALLPLGLWIPVIDGDPAAAALYMESYASERSRERREDRNTLLHVGPGQKLVLMTPSRDALFSWRKHDSKAGQVGIECSVFFNRSPLLASRLIRAADAIADGRWPGDRHYTFVNRDRVKGDPPGNCFLHAGWRYVLDEKGEPLRTKERKLLILERLP